MFSLFKERKKRLGVVYWVDMRKIMIPPWFSTSEISAEKYQEKKLYYMSTGQFESTVQLSKDNILVDGYSSYLIAKEYNLGKIPVVYV